VLPFRELRYHCTISVTVSDFCIFYNYAMQHMHFTLNIYLIFRDNASFSIWLLEVLVPIHRIHIIYFFLVIFHFAINHFRQTSICLSVRFHSFVRISLCVFEKSRNKPPPTVNFEQDRHPSILTEIVQSTKYIRLRYSAYTNNNDDRLMIDWQKINVAAAFDPRQDWLHFFSSFFPFFFL